VKKKKKYWGAQYVEIGREATLMATVEGSSSPWREVSVDGTKKGRRGASETGGGLPNSKNSK